MMRALFILFLFCLPTLAQVRVVKIWEIPTELTTVSNSDQVAIADMHSVGGPTTKRITVGNLTGLIGSGFLALPTNSPANSQFVQRTGDANKWITLGTSAYSNSTAFLSSSLNVVTQNFAPDMTFLSGVSASSFTSGDSVTATSLIADSLNIAGGNATIDVSGFGTFTGASMGAGGLSWGSGVGVLGNNGSATFANASITVGGQVNSTALQSSGLSGGGARVVKTDNVGVLGLPSASGAVPIDADGTAATFGQINALATGDILTNGHSALVTVSNRWTFKDAANATATITNGVVAAIVTASSLTNAGATASAVVITDANKKEIGLANGGAQTYVEGTTPPTYTYPFGVREWAGNTGNALIAAGVTCFYAPNGNSQTNVITTDTSVFTRNVVAKSTTFTNLNFILSAAPGASRTCTLTLMTNGVASSVVATATGAATTATSGSTSDPVIAGVQFGIRIVTQASSPSTLVSWSVEGFK